MKKAISAAAILLMTVLEAPLARGESCPDFDKAVETTMAFNNDVDAQLARIKAMGKPCR